MGEIFGGLLGVPASACEHRAELCGRFNLGISLFDFICDEAGSDDIAELQRLPSLHHFTGTAPDVREFRSGTLKFLDRIVASVLGDFVEEIGPPRKTRRGGLWGALFAMFEAEMTRARLELDHPTPTDAVREALRLSSAEPFRVMAQWMVERGTTPPQLARRAAHLGRCVGDCFWLIDDARDVWADLYAGRWNLFLLEAKSAEPSLRLSRPTPVLEQHLTDLWIRERTAERTARWAVRRLARTLSALPGSQRRTRSASERLHAAMHTWA